MPGESMVPRSRWVARRVRHRGVSRLCLRRPHPRSGAEV